MCVGIPMQILTCDGLQAQAKDGTSVHTLDMSLIGEKAPGTWVLTFLGSAREVLTEDDARKIEAAIAALRSIMSGEQPAIDAFADLEERGPQLPPHLQAALNSTETNA